jgi:predicted nucleic acid-binding protein
LKVIVDTCVWSLALRRKTYSASPVAHELERLIKEFRVQMIGPIRQEILSGIRSKAQFNSLKDRLSNFPDVPVITEDYERAADFFNLCRAKGVQGSNTDFLICAVENKKGRSPYQTSASSTLDYPIKPACLLPDSYPSGHGLGNAKRLIPSFPSESTALLSGSFFFRSGFAYDNFSAFQLNTV